MNFIILIFFLFFKNVELTMPSYTVIGVVVITIICLLLGYEFVSFDKQHVETGEVEFMPRVILFLFIYVIVT